MVAKFFEIILIPARGRKHVTRSCTRRLYRDYTHPRKGTETRMQRSRMARERDYTHPRKGTETISAYFLQFLSARLYSSPQGDGNTNRTKHLVVNQIILIPARGRKPLSYRRFCFSLQDYTHPRKGTETCTLRYSLLYPSDYTHPRKGTETILITFPDGRLTPIILIPARGRKLMMVLLFIAVVVAIILIPARGRKLSADTASANVI